MGVFLKDDYDVVLIDSLPHARGGVSFDYEADDILIKSSPRPWGCFFKTLGQLITANVFPTPVGVFQIYLPAHSVQISLPHARGGVSLIVYSLND